MESLFNASETEDVMAFVLGAVPAWKAGAALFGFGGAVSAHQALKNDAKLPGGKSISVNDVSYSRIAFGNRHLEVMPSAVRPQELTSSLSTQAVDTTPKRAVLFQKESAAQTKYSALDSMLL